MEAREPVIWRFFLLLDTSLIWYLMININSQWCFTWQWWYSKTRVKNTPFQAEVFFWEWLGRGFVLGMKRTVWEGTCIFKVVFENCAVQFLLQSSVFCCLILVALLTACCVTVKTGLKWARLISSAIWSTLILAQAAGYSVSCSSPAEADFISQSATSSLWLTLAEQCC